MREGLLLLFLLFSQVAGQPHTVVDGDVVYCDQLFLRSGCGETGYDLVCGAFDLKDSEEVIATVPVSGGRFTNDPNPDAAKVVTFNIRGLYGNFQGFGGIQGNNDSTEVRLFVDSVLPFQALGIQISYDFNGDGTAERTEVYQNFATDMTPTQFQETNILGINLQPGGGLVKLNPAGGFANFVNGAIELKVWSAFDTNGTLFVATNKRSYIKIPYLATYWRPFRNGSSCDPATTVATNQPKKVAFVLETVQDFYLNAGVVAIMDVFKSFNASLTLGIIGSLIGTDGTIRNAINQARAVPYWDVELACNGHVYNLYSNLTYQQQKSDLTSCVTAIDNTFNVYPKSFIPPYSSINTFTTRALIDSGFTHFAAPAPLLPYPYAMKNTQLYRYGQQVRTYSDYDVYNPSATLIGQMDALLNNPIATQNEGVVVVSMTATEFMADSGGQNVNDIVDTANIADLNNLLNLIKQRGWELVTLSRINADAANTSTPKIERVDCNCVAFRLDDIQDFYLSPAQRAVINTFQAKAAPLTVGVIGNYFNDAVGNVDMAPFLRTALLNASSSQCFDLEIANHGWLHENFALLESAAATKNLLDLTNDKVQQLLQVRPTMFLPPFNAFGIYTIQAMNMSGMTHFSSQTDIDSGPFDYVNRKYGIYRFPIGASTSFYDGPDYFQGVPYTRTLTQILNQLNNYGYAHVMMHPQEYSVREDVNGTATFTNVVNTTQLEQLSLLIDAVRALGLRIVTVSSIQNYFGNNQTDPCIPSAILTTAQPTTATPTTAGLTSDSTTGASAGTTGSVSVSSDSQQSSQSSDSTQQSSSQGSSQESSATQGSTSQGSSSEGSDSQQSSSQGSEQTSAATTGDVVEDSAVKFTLSALIVMIGLMM